VNPPDLAVILYQVIRWTHILTGFLGFYTGFVPLFSRKGGRAHRRWGKVFVWAMGISAVTALPLALHARDAFQAFYALYAGCLAYVGGRVVAGRGRLSRPLLSGAALVCAGAVVAGLFYLFPVARPVGWTFLVFGGIGLTVAIILWRTPPDLALRSHALTMNLAFLAALSAFANTHFQKITKIPWPLHWKMLLPVALYLPFLLLWLWRNRARWTAPPTVDRADAPARPE
jgi:uncharacterized membrane protein